MASDSTGSGHHTPGRRPLTLRFPYDLHRWLHRTSVMEGRTKTALLAEAVTWIQSRSQWPDLLRSVVLPDDEAQRSSTFDLPPEVYVWLRLESLDVGWSANELAMRTLVAWRTERTTASSNP